MPKLDKTGPSGQGPLTGRGTGPCSRSSAWGIPMGCGRGYGFGYRRFYNKKEEAEMLKEEAEMLQEELNAIKERLGEIKG